MIVSTLPSNLQNQLRLELKMSGFPGQAPNKNRKVPTPSRSSELGAKKYWSQFGLTGLCCWLPSGASWSPEVPFRRLDGKRKRPQTLLKQCETLFRCRRVLLMLLCPMPKLSSIPNGLG